MNPHELRIYMKNDLNFKQRFESSLAENVPIHMHAGVRNYVYEAVEPEVFLTSLIVKDPWIEVLRNADDINQECMLGWARFFHNAVPPSIWGSREKFREHLATRQPEYAEG